MRDDTINALVAKDTGKTSKNPSSRNNADSIRIAASDEFDQGRADAQERLLKEAIDEEERLSESPHPLPHPHPQPQPQPPRQQGSNHDPALLRSISLAFPLRPYKLIPLLSINPEEEIAAQKGAGVQVREKRKTRARMEADNVKILSTQHILFKLAELEGKVKKHPHTLNLT